MERIKRNVKELVDDFQADDIEMLDTTGVVLKFNAKAPPETIEWLCHLIRLPISSGGAEINIQKYETNDGSLQSNTFILTADLLHFFSAAERYALLKRTHEGHLTPFIHEDRYQFENFEDDNEMFFSCSEKQLLLKFMLDHVICEDEDIKFVPGYSKIKVYKSRPVLPRCIARNIIQIYPLQDLDEMKPLKRKWYLSLSNWCQPIEDIKSYFGEKIALYFYFLDFYTKYLIPPAIIGLGHYLFFTNDNKSDNVWFAVLNLLWATVFWELWKRKMCFLIFDWGRLKPAKAVSDLLEKPRAEYRGSSRISPITGLLEPYYPGWRRRLKMYLVTYPTLILSLIFAVFAMGLYLEFQQKMASLFKDSSSLWSMILKKTPGVLYATVIYFVNNIYGRIAVTLNDWENHRVQTSYDNHLIIKLTLFYFVNSYISSFYIGFYLQDMSLLRQHLATLLVTQQLIQQVRETITPYLKYKQHFIRLQKDGKKISVKRISDPKNQVIREGNMPVYDGTFQDYLEMVLQFGYVFMFSAVYPLAAFWALLNNISELRTDAFKLCRLFQRPFATEASSIGAWEGVFEFMGIVAVITNCGLIALSPTMQEWLAMDSHPVRYVLIFFAVEHVLIILKFSIGKAIPDVPGTITKQLAKREFRTQQAIQGRGIRQSYAATQDGWQEEH